MFRDKELKRVICAMHIAAVTKSIGLLILVVGFRLMVAGTPPADSLLSLELSDGSLLKGTIIAEEPDSVVFMTTSGLRITLPKSIIVSRRTAHGRMVTGEFRRSDPNYTRLLFTPTGHPLGKGVGYITDYYVFFPGIAYGLTDRLSIMAGFSLIPGIPLRDQMVYVAPRFGLTLADRFSFSSGFLYLTAPDDFSAGIGFLTGSYGPPGRCITVGIGRGFSGENGDIEWARSPILVWGGNFRLSNSLSLVSENWMMPGENFDIGWQPFSIAIRFFGEHIAVDAGAIILLEILKEGIPIPWLSFVYNFGS